ncbi:MAG: TetR/AcrR family transcriptional regulator [Oceanococcus sp.]
MKAEKNYHHGNLRDTLLTEAHALMAQDGVEGLSLRKLAERAGVSRTAPYHHFKDKHALLCALAVEGFRQLDALLQTLPEHADLPAALAGFVRDYLRFAREQPQRYELMFGRRLWKLATPTDELKQVAYATFRAYAQGIAQQNPQLSAQRALRLAQASWATLHGLCHLMIDGIYIDPADMEEVSDLAVDLMQKGMDTKAPKI